MDLSSLKNQDALIEFLKQNGIPAIPSMQADAYMLHWWEFERISRIADVAIRDGYFFLAITEYGFSLHVYNAQNDWYNYVQVWKFDVTESTFLQDLRRLIFADEGYVWQCVREFYFEGEWQRLIQDTAESDQISPELKSSLFDFNESLVEVPDISRLKHSLVHLLESCNRKEWNNRANTSVLRKFFPPLKYDRWNLPSAAKNVLNELGDALESNGIPGSAEIDQLIQKVNDLHYP